MQQTGDNVRTYDGVTVVISEQWWKCSCGEEFADGVQCQRNELVLFQTIIKTLLGDKELLDWMQRKAEERVSPGYTLVWDIGSDGSANTYSFFQSVHGDRDLRKALTRMKELVP